MAKQVLWVLILAGVSLAPHPVHAQKPAPGAPNPYPITPADSAIHFADSIFHKPTLLYQLVQPDISVDIQAILLRFNNALVANKEWFQQYKTAYAGKTLPYNQRFGITYEEYRRLQNIEKAPPQLVPVDTQRVTVTREAGYIRFKTEGEIQLLDYLQVDLQKGFVLFGSDTIPLVGHTAAPASSLYGEWQGYTWRLEKADAASTLATSRVTARVVEINMGITPPTQPQTQTPPSQPSQTIPAQPSQAPSAHSAQTPQPARIFLRLKYEDMRDGTTAANLELVGYLL